MNKAEILRKGYVDLMKKLSEKMGRKVPQSVFLINNFDLVASILLVFSPKQSGDTPSQYILVNEKEGQEDKTTWNLNSNIPKLIKIRHISICWGWNRALFQLSLWFCKKS